MKKGFTLLELLLVISLIGILVSVAVMRFDFFTEISEKVEIRTMVNQLRFSRNKAISSGKRTYVNFTDEGGNFIVVLSSEDFSDGKKYTYIRRSKSIGKVEFLKSGAPDRGETLIFVGKNREYEITIQPGTGYIRWSK